MGLDQHGIYQRVIINRKDQTVAIDRFDMNWLVDEPFMGVRDHFMPSTKKENTLDFYRHHFWLHKLLKFDMRLLTHYSAWSYKRAFKA